MNPNEASTNTIEESVLTGIERQQRKLTLLTRAAIGLWTLAVVGCAAVLFIYAQFYAPKEKQLLRDYGAKTVAHVQKFPIHRMPDSTPAQDETVRMLQSTLGVQLHMSYVVTRGVLIVASALLLLACGTLATLALSVFSRRMTLQQVQQGLAKISEQLQRLNAAK